jgi:hypothetical protein
MSSFWTRRRASAPDVAIVATVALMLAIAFAVFLFGP